MKTKLFFGEKKHTIREAGLATERKFFGKRGVFVKAGHVGHLTKKKNPKGYGGTLKLPIYIDTAVSGVLNEGPRSLDWTWDRRMSPENKKHFHDFLVSVHHPLAYEAGTPEQRFKRFVLEYVMPYINKNPRRNPITLVGNPPKQVRATIAGILYRRVIEVRAEKTGGPHKGLWYHTFKTGSDVQLLALDNGDLLIHSISGKRLWREA